MAQGKVTPTGVARLRAVLIALSMVAVPLLWPVVDSVDATASAAAGPTPTRSSDPTPTRTPTRSPTATPTRTTTATPTGTPTRTPTRSPSPTPTRTSDTTASPSAKPTPTRTSDTTASPSTKPTPTLTPTRTPDATPTTAAPATSSATPTPGPPPSCALSALNLAQNPGFEQVSGPGSSAYDAYPLGIALGGIGWPMRESAATSDVPSWTGTNVYPDPGYPRVKVLTNGTFLLQTTPYGSRSALVPGFRPDRPQEIVGVLSSPTSIGATYVLSAQINALDMTGSRAPTVELRLRESATGTQSAPFVTPSTTAGGSQNWAVLTGAVTANAHYDRVVLRFQGVLNEGGIPSAITSTYGPGGQFLGLIDDVRVCKAALYDRPPGWWTTVRAVGAAVLGSVLIAGLVWGRRRFRTRGRLSAATVRG